MTASIVTGSYVDPSAGKITVAAYSVEWRTRRTWAPSSARMAFETLSAMLGAAVEDERLSRNPAKGARLPAGGRSAVRAADR